MIKNRNSANPDLCCGLYVIKIKAQQIILDNIMFSKCGKVSYLQNMLQFLILPFYVNL